MVSQARAVVLLAQGVAPSPPRLQQRPHPQLWVRLGLEVEGQINRDGA
jgi:hypothetical protein